MNDPKTIKANKNATIEMMCQCFKFDGFAKEPKTIAVRDQNPDFKAQKTLQININTEMKISTQFIILNFFINQDVVLS